MFYVFNWYFLVALDKTLFVEIFSDTNDWSLTICILGWYFVDSLVEYGIIEDLLYVEVSEGASTIDVEGVGYLSIVLHSSAISNYGVSA